MKKLIVTAAIVGLVAVIAGPAIAGGKGAGSSISLVRLSDAARLTSSSPTLGEQVTFDVSTTRTDWPWVQNRCWQDGRLVYEEWRGFYAGYAGGTTFVLGPTNNWSGGSAECEGRLVRYASGGNAQTLASTKYNVIG
jgi:hypothetical protein